MGSCLFVCLILYIPVSNFQSYQDGSSWVETVPADKVSCSRTQHSDSVGEYGFVCSSTIINHGLSVVFPCLLLLIAWTVDDQKSIFSLNEAGLLTRRKT